MGGDGGGGRRPKVHRVLLFAAAREALGGQESVTVELPAAACDTEALRAKLGEAFPALAPVLAAAALALNMEYVPAGEAMGFKEGDELAVIPPISGG